MVEFVLRSGNLGGERDFMGSSRALDGTRGHQKIQKSRPPGYRAEVRVKHELPRREFVLRINGRIDGVLESADELLIEEIKTVTGNWQKAAHPLHWAQARIYAHLFGLQNQARAPIRVRLTYLHLDSGEITEFEEVFEWGALAQFFDEVTRVYLDWAERQHEWMKVRDASIGSLGFPHADYRTGQRALAVAAYRALANGGKLFVEAPTGIGKTVSVLFPAIKAIGEGHLEKVFFLTAKTTGRAIAQSSVAIMKAAGLRLRALTVTARDKICFSQGQPCEAQSCPFAIGYYDRIKPAILEALTGEMLQPEDIEAIARRHHVCPFELSLDVSLWVDLIICDYNYVFDPRVSLKRFFAEEGGDYGFLVDEAHNLVDRAREMFSAGICLQEILALREAIGEAVPSCQKALRNLERCFREQSRETAAVTRELPGELLRCLERFLEVAEEWLVLNTPSDFRAPLLELFFQAFAFVRTAALFDDRYVTIFEKQNEPERYRLYCLDPSKGIQQALSRGKGAIFFSATLRPIEYFREILGGEIGDAVLQLASPFPTEQLEVIVHRAVQTSFRARNTSYGKIAQSISALIEARPGNYLVFFPSYKYLEAVRNEFVREHPFVPVISQTSAMSEAERSQFISAFQAGIARPLLGFAVMGGVFGEGIDLVGDRLVGAIVVGVGLPQLSLDRDLIRNYFHEKNGLGFEYAYAWPGLNRVIQAAGRVIRSEEDRGIVLLIDTRFTEARYREMLPAWWNPTIVRNEQEIAQQAKRFWGQPAEFTWQPLPKEARVPDLFEPSP